jgi:hypothetical protein
MEDQKVVDSINQVCVVKFNYKYITDEEGDNGV